MDGAPVKGESIPIRLFLAGFELAPTMRDVFKKFSVRYFLNLVLIDEEDRRYFKQQEIQIWRKGPTKKTAACECHVFLSVLSLVRNMQAHELLPCLNLFVQQSKQT